MISLKYIEWDAGLIVRRFEDWNPALKAAMDSGSSDKVSARLKVSEEHRSTIARR
jgi:hypothetical protein